jgi:hypothetical protein
MIGIVSDSGTNNNVMGISVLHLTSGTPLANFGVNISMGLHDSANVQRTAFYQQILWNDPATGNYTSLFRMFLASKAATGQCFQIEGSATTQYAYNFGFIQNNANPNYQSMVGGIYQGNVTTEPSGNPSSGLYYYALSGGPKWWTSSGATMALTAAGAFSVTGSITAGTGFGCNGQAAQTAYASGGALAAYVTGAFGLDSDANMSALHALVVKIRAALVANGIMS